MTDSARLDALIARLNDAIGIRHDGTLELTDAHVRDMREAAAAIASLRDQNERLIASEMKMAMMQSETYLRAETAEAELAAAQHKMAKLR